MVTTIHQRPPLRLRISITDRCQLHCRYCRPPSLHAVLPRPENDRRTLRNAEIVAFARQLQSQFDLQSIRLTGGEPLMAPGIVSLVRDLAALDVGDMALTTNGQRLAALAQPLRNAGLQRVNISLDSLIPQQFARITGGGQLGKTLDGIRAAQAAGLTPVKLNAVMIRNRNDGELESLLIHALDQGCEIRFLEIMPIGPGASRHAREFVAASTLQRRLAARFDLTPIGDAHSASARRYRVRPRHAGRAGVLGFIAPCSRPFCDGCTRLRLTADGRLIGCLARDDGIDIRPLIGDPEVLAAAARMLRCKRTDRQFHQPAAMTSIGG